MGGQNNEEGITNDNNGELIITLAEFFAFGQKNQKIYFHNDMEQINSDLQNICNTNRLMSISVFSAKPLSKKEFKTTFDEQTEGK